MAKMLMDVIRSDIKERPLAVAGAALASPAFKSVIKLLDFSVYGGVALLGVNGVVIIGHGRSDAYAVRNAIRVAHRAVESDVIGAIKGGLETEA